MDGISYNPAERRQLELAVSQPGRSGTVRQPDLEQRFAQQVERRLVVPRRELVCFTEPAYGSVFVSVILFALSSRQGAVPFQRVVPIM